MNKPSFSTNSAHAVRAKIRQRRKALSFQEQSIASEALLIQLRELVDVGQANNIAIYLSNDGELNPELFIQWCWQQGINTYLPVLHPFSKGQLLFLRYHQHSQMKANIYGILEPKLSVLDIISTSDLDIIFTPLVAFDAEGNRMGMGGGFYDRTLSKWYQQFQSDINAKPRPIGLAHDCQKVERLAVQDWDIPLAKIVTPTAIYDFTV
ncbi:5-formyltetrahydrofolate cyclo-ligase [Thalassotalea piscium]|uniref:5-formyltetrahydrofolate cyclo-ligase n=1 Tax=Thalassotalea piscium TaxID=1230533 RepID=A0A7X0NE81_9GAMM|nr:5-formyltetrahydrofolate cyclo-ligase [Thalassotalea piscium]MBB6541826.1 5-formyltetrahydrofolate cyclo-ligase [Thalassotalea piscium]